MKKLVGFIVVVFQLFLNPLIMGADLGPGDWSAQQYQDREAQVGDTLTFKYGILHNVYLIEKNDCALVNSPALQPSSKQEPNFSALKNDGISQLIGTRFDGMITVTLDEIGEYCFACSTLNHCEKGQVFCVNVTE